MRKKKKIEIATAEEVEAYGGPDRADTPEAAAEAPEGQVPQAEAPEDQAPPEDELTAARRKIEELTDKHLRAVAEHQNYVRRARAEHGEALRYAATDVIRSLLEVVDDFERTLAAVPQDDPSPLAKGVRLVYEKLIKALETHHVQRIESVGRPFDPSCHEAMMQQVTADQPAGTVLEEYQSGYRLWDRVVRPAKVVVAKAVAEAEPDSAEAGGDAGPQEDADAERAGSADPSADQE